VPERRDDGSSAGLSRSFDHRLPPLLPIDRDRHRLLLSDDHDQLLVAGDRRIEQASLQYCRVPTTLCRAWEALGTRFWQPFGRETDGGNGMLK
jgi:hypothetical protein